MKKRGGGAGNWGNQRDDLNSENLEDKYKEKYEYVPKE